MKAQSFLIIHLKMDRKRKGHMYIMKHMFVMTNVRIKVARITDVSHWSLARTFLIWPLMLLSLLKLALPIIFFVLVRVPQTF
jgi:membrane-associated PAP2 superfamily phosphatase